MRFSQLLSAPFIAALETQIFMNNPRNWWSMDPSALREISLTVRWLWGLSSWLSNSDSTASTFSSVCARRLPLPGRLSTVPNFCCLLMLFVVQPLFRNFVTNYQALQPLHSFRFLIKISSPLLNSVRQSCHVCFTQRQNSSFGVRFERRKINLKKGKPT